MSQWDVWEIVALVSGVISIGLALALFRWVMKQKNENDKMAYFSGRIQEGASTYLKRLYQALGILAGVITIIILCVPDLGWRVAIAFLVGSACSAMAGYSGMYVSTRANARVAWAARGGLVKALPVGFFAGAVMGFSVVGFALIGMTVIYMIWGDPHVVLGFSFGASTLALLAKAGGGIYTKTADIGADLVGKVEFDLVEDDPRNPAVIADNVGDNVGDVAGMGADILDSFVASVVSVMILGSTLSISGPNGNVAYVVFPLLLSAAGVFASLAGMFFVVGRKEGSDPGRALNTGTISTTIVFALLLLAVTKVLPFGNQWQGVFWPTLAGLLAGVVIGFTSDFFTDIDQKAVQNTSKAALTGPALVILER